MNNKHKIIERIKEIGLLAVIRGTSKTLTIKTVEALIKGGVIGIEITYTTPQAEEVVSELKRIYGEEILLGMGTLTEPDQAKSAKKAGANFLVSPICEPSLVNAMVDSELVVMAGALTPTEIFQAYQLGVDVVKIFPGSLAGPNYLKAIHGPFPYIDMMPTGGVSKSNLREWFTAGAIAIGAGSSLCPKNLIAEGNFDEISNLAAEFTTLIKRARE